jgi:glycosyltransferase involved in cell wall biosynthesis
LLPRVGGNSFLSKFAVLATVPRCFWTTWKATRKAQIIHSRGPSLPAFFCILISFFDSSKVYWHKYAGNWDAKDKPLFYRLQKFLLLRNNTSIVSINGKWSDQRPHILSLENPCLTDDELLKANGIAAEKDFSGKLVLLFVGRITEAKGVGILLQMLSLISDKSRISKVYLIGDGNIPAYQSQATLTGLDIQFTGAQPREELNKFYSEAHVFLLPSLSEGFPKVVAEAAAFGCVPVVSNVSSLGQYVSSENGLLLSSFKPKEMALQLDALLSDTRSLEFRSVNASKMAKDFTFSRLQDRIKKEVISRYLDE